MSFRYFVWDDEKPLGDIQKSVKKIESSIREKITDSNWQIDLEEMRVDVEKAKYRLLRNTNERHAFIRVTVNLDLNNALPPDVINLLRYLETDKEKLWSAPHVKSPLGLSIFKMIDLSNPNDVTGMSALQDRSSISAWLPRADVYQYS